MGRSGGGQEGLAQPRRATGALGPEGILELGGQGSRLLLGQPWARLSSFLGFSFSSEQGEGLDNPNLSPRGPSRPNVPDLSSAEKCNSIQAFLCHLLAVQLWVILSLCFLSFPI